MKRTLALFLALLMALSLVACGGDDTTATLTSTEWKAVLNYMSGSGERTLSFEKDGTGSFHSSGGHGGNFTWSAQDDEVDVKLEAVGFSGGSSFYSYTFDLVEGSDSYRLVENDKSENSGHWIFVPEDKYESETSALKAERKKEAKSLDWDAVSRLRAYNIAECREQYKGKLLSYTGFVTEIHDGYCYMNTRNPITAYVSGEDLANIKTGDLITVIGFLSVSELSASIYDAFIVEE